jgi:hypothetical protein
MILASFRNLALSGALLVLIGCNATSQNAPPPDVSAGPVENPLPAPPSSGPLAGKGSGKVTAPPTSPEQAQLAPLVQTTAPGQAGRPALVSDPNFTLPNGAGCSGKVERFQALIDNDLKTGHTTKGVHDEISTELTSLRGRCSNGEDATDDVTLLRQRFGYPSI